MAVCAPRAHIKIRRYFPSLVICCRKVAPYFLSRATARRSTNIILYSLLFIILLSQRHARRRAVFAAQRLAKPAIVRLVAVHCGIV